MALSAAGAASPKSPMPDKQLLLKPSDFFCQVILTFCNNIVKFSYISKQKRKKTMYTTVNEDGIINNYAAEPKMYYAEYPAIWEQRKYVLQGLFATLIVTTIVLVGFTVS